jgi:polyisoprenoid-binding protein YceI
MDTTTQTQSFRATVIDPRQVERLIAGQATSDGANFRVTRVLMQNLQRRLDRFLMVPARLSAALALGASLLLTPPGISAQGWLQAPEAAVKPGGAPVKGARFEIDPTHTFVMYEIGHYGTTTNRGRFSTKQGSIQIDSNGMGGKVDIVMDMSSINTGVDLLNRHVQSKDFLNVADFPTARFVAEGLGLDGDKVSEVRGSLTMLGQSRPVRLKASRFNCYISPVLNRQVCGGDFETTIERSQWGITWGLNFGFEDKVRLLVQVEAVHIP